MKTKNKNILYCFSPAVMVVTLIIEFSLALYVFYRAKASRVKSLVIITLILLGLFQLAEFMVCGAYSQELVGVASRVGYVAITFLPAVGIHLTNEIAERRPNWLVIASYGLAGCFALYFGFAPAAINSSICTGNYVIFNLRYYDSHIYTIYYFGLLFAMIGLSVKLAGKQKDSHKRSALRWLMVGTLIFLIPTGLVYWVNPSVELAIPSIMCGFAVLYAIILVGKIIPLTTKPKRA